MNKTIIATILSLTSLSFANAATIEKAVLHTEVGDIAANIYLPDDIENPPVVIITGAWTTVKEQMPANYAEALVNKGYAAVTFDFRGWGESKDTVKYLEDPARKTEDIKAVINAVSKFDKIDSSRIATLGICASAGYSLDAIVGNEKIKAGAVVAPWLHDRTMAINIYGGEENFSNLISTSKKAQDSEKDVIIEAASTTNPNSLMYQAPYYTETERGLIPEYDNKFNVESWNGWLNYDAQLSASVQDKPVLMVSSESMALPLGAHSYLENSGDNVSSVWLNDVNQFDFYDNTKAINDSVKAIVEHFETNL